MVKLLLLTVAVVLALFCQDSTALTCYSCDNCGTSTGTLVTCASGASTCTKFSFAFLFDSMTNKGCTSSCTEVTGNGFYEVTCCTSNACNGAESTVKMSTFSMMAALIFGLASVVLRIR